VEIISLPSRGDKSCTKRMDARLPQSVHEDTYMERAGDVKSAVGACAALVGLVSCGFGGPHLYRRSLGRRWMSGGGSRGGSFPDWA
jgi:hypothetical protein